MEIKSEDKQIEVKEDHIVINVVYEYNIPLNRCRNYTEILGWVLHLSEKTWVTSKLLRRFIHVALKANELKVPQA